MGRGQALGKVLEKIGAWLSKRKSQQKNGSDAKKTANEKGDPKQQRDQTCGTCRPRSELISDQRANHILNGDKTGGGHRAGAGKGKSEFPKNWSDDKVLDSISDVAQTGKPMGAGKTPGSTLMNGVKDGVDMTVVVGKDGKVITGWPNSGAGVKPIGK